MAKAGIASSMPWLGLDLRLHFQSQCTACIRSTKAEDYTPDLGRVRRQLFQDESANEAATKGPAAAEELEKNSSIADEPEAPIAEDFEKNNSIADGASEAEAPIAAEDFREKNSSIADDAESEAPLAAEDFNKDNSIADAASEASPFQSKHPSEGSCTPTEPETCDEATKHYSLCEAPEEPQKIKRSARLRPSMLDGFKAISPAEQTRLARAKKADGNDGDGGDDDADGASVEAPAGAPARRGRGRGSGRGRGRGKASHHADDGRGRGRGRDKDSRHADDEKDEADKAAGPRGKRAKPDHFFVS